MNTNTSMTRALQWTIAFTAIVATLFIIGSVFAPAEYAFAKNDNNQQQDNNGNNDGDHNDDDHGDNGNHHDNDDGDNDDNESGLQQLCTNGIDDDNDGLVDLLDPDCAEFIPVCADNQYPNEFLQCVNDPDCTVGQHIDNHVCVNDPTTATVVATKVVCDDESMLPNWGTGGADITSTTATDYVSAHVGCHVASGFSFEYATDPVTNPGDNVEVGGAGWTVFGMTDVFGVATTQILAGVKTWFREQLPEGYIPFTFNANEGSNVDPVSAELYCHTDVLNYDNFDWINPVEVGSTYYCVAFNVAEEVVVTPACSDDSDNDTDTFTDETDPGCHTDGNAQNEGSYDPEDNDETDTIVVESTDVCENIAEVQETVPQGMVVVDGDQCVEDDSDDTTEGGGGNGGNGDPAPTSFLGGGPITGGGILTSGNGNGGQVLGESCGLYMGKFLRIGKKNDFEQVKKLQAFLNKQGFGPIPETGFFGPLTLAAVNAFQQKHAGEVLTPWNLNGPTGIVYQTTLRWINKLECPALTLNLPPLVEWSKNHEVPN